MNFQEACNSKGHSPDAVESLITRTVIGLYGETKLTPDKVELIDKAKQLYTSFSSGDWQEQAHRAVFYLFYTSGQQMCYTKEVEVGIDMKAKVTVTMDAELKEALKAYCKAHNYSMNTVINELILDYLADHA